MATVKGLCAYRPAKGTEEEVSALPYDVYNRQEARAAVQGHPLSFLNIDRPETFFPEDFDMYASAVYEKASEVLHQQIQSGVYGKDAAERYYLYELTMNGRSQTGIVACASIDDYAAGIIKKHENTREEKEQDRIRHIDACNMQTGPIFLAYRQNKTLADVVCVVKKNEPLFDFTATDGIRHRGWMVEEPAQMEAITEGFAKTNYLYIADGHHRAASAVKVGFKRRKEHPGYTGKEEFNYFLSVIFPDEELMIMDYNRVVRDLNGLSSEAFLQRVLEVCDITASGEPVKPSCKGQMGMYLDGQWYVLSLHKDLLCDDPVEGLDVSLLQKEILHPILGIGDPRLDQRIDFVGGIRGLSELERRVETDCAVAFSMYPTSIAELFAVADAGRLMPPKSTWFEPKLRSGLFLHEIEA